MGLTNKEGHLKSFTGPIYLIVGPRFTVLVLFCWRSMASQSEVKQWLNSYPDLVLLVRELPEQDLGTRLYRRCLEGIDWGLIPLLLLTTFKKFSLTPHPSIHFRVTSRPRTPTFEKPSQSAFCKLQALCKCSVD